MFQVRTDFERKVFFSRQSNIILQLLISHRHHFVVVVVFTFGDCLCNILPAGKRNSKFSLHVACIPTALDLRTAQALVKRSRFSEPKI